MIVADSCGDEFIDGVNIYDVGKADGGRIKRMRVTGEAIFKKVLELHPKVVHFHDPELIGIGRKLAKLGYLVVYDVHEDVPKQVMNKAWIPRLVRPLVAKYVEYRERTAAKIFAGVLCATEIIARRFKRYDSNVCVIHNFPILAELDQENTPWESRQDKLCYLGSISETRGILPLVDSLAISGLTLELAGSYSNQEVEAKITASHGYSYVNYHGILNRDGVKKLLASVKFGMVTLLPTPSYIESLPIKMFEYMLSGIPVIASNFPLWQEIIEVHKCGLLVDPASPDQIAKASLWLSTHQLEAKQMGENGRRAVLEHYSWESEKVKLMTFYDGLIR